MRYRIAGILTMINGIGHIAIGLIMDNPNDPMMITGGTTLVLFAIGLLLQRRWGLVSTTIMVVGGGIYALMILNTSGYPIWCGLSFFSLDLSTFVTILPLALRRQS